MRLACGVQQGTCTCHDGLNCFCWLHFQLVCGANILEEDGVLVRVFTHLNTMTCSSACSMGEKITRSILVQYSYKRFWTLLFLSKVSNHPALGVVVVLWVDRPLDEWKIGVEKKDPSASGSKLSSPWSQLMPCHGSKRSICTRVFHKYQAPVLLLWQPKEGKALCWCPVLISCAISITFQQWSA